MVCPLVSNQLQVECSINMSRKAQTLEQRRRNAKFLKEQENKMGKSEAQIKARQKAPAPKVPVSPFWIGMFPMELYRTEQSALNGLLL